jgi:N-acetylglucosamine-6-phosphate deacetylase
MLELGMKPPFPATSGKSFSVRGRMLVGGELVPGAVVVDEATGTIAEVRAGGAQALGDLPAPILDADVVSPGLVDLQVNGGFGFEVGGDPEALRALAARLPGAGVTTFLPAIVSTGADSYRAAAAALAAARAAPPTGARMPGLHLEGPMLAVGRAGAHDRRAIAAAQATLDDALEPLLATGAVRVMTVAPERPGALGLIRRLREAGVTVALGHTDATFEQMIAGIEAGAQMVTHLYSAMRGFHHRDPGAVGAALVDDRVVAALIADGVHAHGAALALALRAKGANRLALVSDAVPAAGGPPGAYQLAGMRVFSDGQAARLDDGTLAGSASTLDRGVRVMVSQGGATLGEALTMATAVPARLLGATDSFGRIAPGLAADLVLWDSAMQVEATFIGGRRADGGGAP